MIHSVCQNNYHRQLRLVRQYLWRYLHTYIHVHTSCSIFTSKWRLIGYKGVNIFMLNIALFITYIKRNAECIKWIFDLYVHVIHKIRQSSARIDYHDTEYSESKVFFIMMYTKLQTLFKDKPTVITHNLRRQTRWPFWLLDCTWDGHAVFPFVDTHDKLTEHFVQADHLFYMQIVCVRPFSIRYK